MLMRIIGVVIAGLSLLQAASAQAAPAISNGSMSQGGDVPLGWDRTHADQGELRVVRDTADFVSGPSSLRLESVGGAASGNCNQVLDGAAGETFVVRGQVKARDVDYATVSLMAQGQDWGMLKWMDLVRFQDKSDWTAFEAEVAIPAEARNVMLMVQLQGAGKVWVDDLEVVGGRRKADPIDLSQFSGDPPRVTNAATVAPDVLGITIRAQDVLPASFERYEPQPGDQLGEPGGMGSARALTRNGRRAGNVVGRDELWLHTPGRLTGVPLQVGEADEPSNYTITSADDPDYAAGLTPVDVHRKSKAVSDSPHRYFPQEHQIYLLLPQPLKIGSTYVVAVANINLAEDAITYRHEPPQVRSESVHVSQIGFRPDDPVKVAYLSLWMGTGGGYAGYAAGTPFSVIDAATGEAVHTGVTRLSKAAADVSPGLHAKGRNFNSTDVYAMDFAEVTRPGTYRVCVDGIGCSYEFPVADNAWEEAFKVAARGYYHQRSGIALEEPYTDWTRPRGFHPDDGKVVYDTTFRRSQVGEYDSWFEGLVENRTDEIVPDAWGGYFDAGDWDRGVVHLVATRKKLELLEMFPDYLADLELNIPESGNDLPDLLDEALWNIDCYRRMQTPEGGIRGGIESEEHPAADETSWTDTLLLMAYAPDYDAAWLYAGVAARAAHWMATHGHVSEGGTYSESALRAMAWAEADFARQRADGQYGSWHEKDNRNLAALELYRLTGEQQWHDLFRSTCGFAERPVIFQWGSHVQRDAAFVYARLPEALADPQIRRNAVEAIIADAEDELAFSSATAFGWTVPDAGAPIIIGKLSAPQSVRSARAWAITGEDRFLEGALRAAQYGAGANPMNMVMTSGLGHKAVENLLVVDAGRMGRKTPPGITVYGPMDLQFSPAPAWVTTWKLIPHVNVEPPIQEWPVTEAYWDIFSWPMMCEYTVHQGMPETLFVWGCLASRGR
jgi:endoglucanase